MRSITSLCLGVITFLSPTEISTYPSRNLGEPLDLLIEVSSGLLDGPNVALDARFKTSEFLPLFGAEWGVWHMTTCRVEEVRLARSR